MGKLTISMGMLHSYATNYQRVSPLMETPTWVNTVIIYRDIYVYLTTIINYHSLTTINYD